MRPIDFDPQKVVDSLQGTCQTLNEAISALYPDMTDYDLTTDDYLFIDQEIFNCNECGWWYEISEQADNEDETICTNCLKE